LRTEKITWLVLTACVAAAAGALLLGPRSAERGKDRHRESSPLAVIPPGPALLVTLDPWRLTQGSARDALVRGGANLFGMGGGECEIATLLGARQVALAVAGQNKPRPATDLEIALVASGDFDSAKVSACAEQAITRRKGHAVRTRIGSFLAVRDQESTSGEVAVRNGGPLVLSGGGYLRQILDVADGKPIVGGDLEKARDTLHRTLREGFGRSAPLVATLTLPPGWLEAYLDDPDARLSPLAKLRSAALRGEPAGDGYLAEALLVHEDARAAEAVETFLREVLDTFGPLVEQQTSPRVRAQLTPRREGEKLKFSVHLTREELERVFAPLLSR
jgi:hypothetical protein